MGHSLEKKFPVNAKDYKLYEEIGDGVSATVFRALCIPLNEIVAIKVLDLEKCNNDLDGIRREVHTMNLINHPNLLKSHCSFTNEHNLWVVMPYMAGGSCMHIMKSSHPEGFDELVIATLLYEVLKALAYLHENGHIHRDVKSGNILVDLKGAVRLADFGVSACMFDTGDRQRSRNTFVGTPCWMAPEVMQQMHGYDFKADIWSFGITALELAHGHAPFSKYPPMKVLLMTLQNAPPGLDYERDKRFSKSFKELVGACLVKDPKKRPTSEKLLKHQFFKQARPVNYLAQTILDGLAPLGDRFRTLKAKEASLLRQNKTLYEEKEQQSQKEYIRGISEWNFNLEDLKRQAAMIQDDDVENPEYCDSAKQIDRPELFPVERQSPETVSLSQSAPSGEDTFDSLRDMESSLASVTSKPLLAPKERFGIGKADQNESSGGWRGNSSDSEGPLSSQSSLKGAIPDVYVLHKNSKSGPGDHKTEREEEHIGHDGLSGRDAQTAKQASLKKKDIDKFSKVEDTTDGAIVQLKGRFKITETGLYPKLGSTSCFPPSGSSSFTTPNPATGLILPSLHSILQQNTAQRDEIIKLMKLAEQMNDTESDTAEVLSNQLLQASPVSVRERELQSLAINLQKSVKSLIEELQKQRLRNAQLEKQIASLTNQR